MKDSIHVICFGKNPQLLHTREAILAREYRTTAVDTLASLLKLSFECSFELVVLCHTLSEAEYQQAVVFLHSCCPRAGIIALTSVAPTYDHQGSDHTLRSLDGPQALLKTVRSTLIEKHLIA